MADTFTPGAVSILSVGAGHIALTFDTSDEAEKIRASRIVRDMLRRGYALLVQTEPGKWARAYDFDPATSEYVIADLDAPPLTDDQVASLDAASAAEAGAPRMKRRGRQPAKRVPAATAEVVAVGRTAGG